LLDQVKPQSSIRGCSIRRRCRGASWKVNSARIFDLVKACLHEIITHHRLVQFAGRRGDALAFALSRESPPAAAEKRPWLSRFRAKTAFRRENADFSTLNITFPSNEELTISSLRHPHDFWTSSD
jgi:hypothetical protein